MKDGKQQLPSSVSQLTFSKPDTSTPSDDALVEIINKMITTCRNQDDCFFGDYLTLREMNAQSGKKTGQNFVATLLNVVNAATNYNKKLNFVQMRFLSELIFEKFSYLKETEITLFFYLLFSQAQKDTFYGALEIETIMEKLTDFVRVRRAKAIERRDIKLQNEKLEREKINGISWQQHCSQKGIVESETPIGKLVLGIGRETPKDTGESIRKSAEELVNNRWGYNEITMKKAIEAFTNRYGYSPEYILTNNDGTE